MYLLDTNVISELRRAGSGRANAKVEAWAVEAWANRANPMDMFLSVVTVMEIEMGILTLRRRDEQQAFLIRRWFEEQVMASFRNRLLPIDIPIARCAAGLHVPDRQSERDCFIAATAIVHAMTVVTRNVADFGQPGVSTLNPWDADGD